MENLEKYKEILIKFLMTHGIKLVIGIAVLIVGLWVTKLITRGVRKLFEKRNVDPTLRPFLINIL